MVCSSGWLVVPLASSYCCMSRAVGNAMLAGSLSGQILVLLQYGSQVFGFGFGNVGGQFGGQIRGFADQWNGHGDRDQNASEYGGHHRAGDNLAPLILYIHIRNCCK